MVEESVWRRKDHEQDANASRRYGVSSEGVGVGGHQERAAVNSQEEEERETQKNHRTRRLRNEEQ